MRLLATLSLVFLALGLPQAWGAERSFVHPGVAKDAARYEAYVMANWKPGKAKPPELKSAGDKLLGTDPRAAARSYALAVAADPGDAEGWIALARALLAIKPDPEKGERYDLPVNASGAAYRAYERAGDDATRAGALAVLAEALQRRSSWRPALQALSASLANVESAEVRQAYEKLRAEHGFRMVDYKAETEASPPRICLQFSERLASTQADLAKFVSVGGKDPQGLSVEAQQLCIEGLAHGERYEIQIKAGLPSDVGEALTKAAELAIYVPDRKPFVRFTGKNYVLPSRGQQGIPVVTVNTNKVAVEVYRVGDRGLSGVIQNGDLQRQLSGYDLEALKERTGVRVYAGELEVAARLNEEVTTALPVSDAIGALQPGAYAMIARPAEGRSEDGAELATQWFIVSDLGLTALSGQDGVHAFVRSLATARAVAGANVRLVARSNEILATAMTDANGYVRFPVGQTRGDGGLQPAILVAENGAGEYAFLDLTTNAFDLSDRGVKGREAPGPLDAYVYTDRGVYRPGEDVFLTALVRDRAGHAAVLPVTLIITRPDGVEHRRFTLSDQGLGGRAATLPLGSGVMTGTWRAKLHADPKSDPLTQIAFLVEDFLPERLELKLDPSKGPLRPDEPFALGVAGRYLYGPPAADLGLEGEVVVKPSARDVEGLPGYRFGLSDETLTPVRKPLEELPATNAEGKANLTVALPPVPKTARPLEADVLVRLRETGGRTVERRVTVPVEIGTPRIGVKPLFGREGVGENETARFEIVHLGADGKRAAAPGLRWTLSRLETTWQWYSRDGSWSYEAVTLTRKAAAGTIDVAAEMPAALQLPVALGRYRLEVTSGLPDGPATSIVFNAGWYSGEETAESPETLDVALDKPSYKAGETARLRIASRQGGRALVAVLGSGLLAAHEVEIPKGGGDVPIAVGTDWGPGAYAAALLYRPMDEAARRMPGRAIGIAWLGLDQSATTLKLTLDAEPRAKPGAKLAIPVKIDGLSAGEEARVTIAAVDAGILNLTRFEAPAPERWFYGQRRLGLEIRDFYGRLIDGMRAERGKLRSGGDGDGGGMSLQGSPPVEDTVALYSGILKVRPDGTAAAEFQLPDFNGALRVMAVAWSADKLGHATSDVVVRDAVALTAAGPRFLTLGDEARLDLSVHNVDGPGATYGISVERQGAPSGANERHDKRALELKPGERKSVRVAVKPAALGLHAYEVAVKGPAGLDVRRRLSFDVKPPAGDIKRTTVSRLGPKGGRLRLSRDLTQDLVPARTRVMLSVGPAAALDVPALLTQLDRYPYGCAEQTVSRALPLVYANAVAAQIGLAEDREIRARVQQAIERVFEMQDASGAFGAWGPSGGDMWLTSYVADFLTRAKEAGYAVTHPGAARSLERLQNFIAYAQELENGGEARAYALYVLARNGRAPVGELRYDADTRLDRFASPLAKAQLGAALAMTGDKERAERAFRAALAALEEPGPDAARADYGSALRDQAALVTLAVESRIAREQAPRLADVVAKAAVARTHTSTQEQAWMLLAAHALGDAAKETKLAIDGKPVAGPLVRSFTAAELAAGDVVISNEGDAEVNAVVSVIGAAVTPEPALAKGFTLERSYYSLAGEKLDLKSAAGGVSELKQNERLVVVLRLEAQEAGGRVLLVDRLPAGLEIENPRLVEGGDVKALDWLKTTLRPEHTEFRDDRFVAAFNFFGNSARGEEGEIEAGENGNTEPRPALPATTVAYIVRAVTPGSFVHPAATVEDMYRPERHARTAAGRLVVTAKE